MPSVRLVVSGTWVQTSWKQCMLSPANCMHPGLPTQTWMICVSASGAPKRGSLSLVNFLHVKIPWTSMHGEPTTSLQYGDEALRPSRLFLPRRMAMDGEVQTVVVLVDSASVGWQDFLPLTWYWNSHLVNSAMYASCLHVNVWPADWSVRTNVHWGSVVTWKRMIHWWNSRNRTKVMKMTVIRMMTRKLCHWTVMLTSTLEIHFFWYGPLIFWPHTIITGPRGFFSSNLVVVDGQE